MKYLLAAPMLERKNKMNFIKHADGVYEAEDFLTEKEQEMLLSCVPGKGWKTYHPGSTAKRIDEKYFLDADKILKKVLSLFENVFDTKAIRELRRLKEGEYMPTHVDGGAYDNPEPIVFGIALYLNDDFTGGELYYPDLKLKIVPKSRSIVVHDAKLRHSVQPVKSGTRYSITNFILGDKSTKFIGYSE